jgi:crotonobetainyl-CoA:carnitine CoA-transferase CaiB-like acyl-CoA transferase
LAGIRVIEFCQVAAGPFCGMLLADMGADVIKVEPPQGDSLRAWPPLSKGFSEGFASLNRNKRSIALDLKEAGDAAIARRLILSADVVVENNRPGVMERLGLGYERFAAEHLRLVYCSVSAFGQTGPRAQDGGFDTSVQAAAGIMSVTGERDGPPVKAGVPIADFASGLYAAFSICACLRRVALAGHGEHVDIPMLGASLGVGAFQTSEYFGYGRDPERVGSAHPRNAPYQAFRASDEYFVLAAGNHTLWASVCRIIEREELIHDPRFVTTTDRAANQRELAEILGAVFAERPADHWITALRTAGVPCELIQSYSQALSQPQVACTGWVQPLQLPSGVMTKTFGSPVVMAGRPAPIRRPPPALDGDRAEILAELDQVGARGA